MKNNEITINIDVTSTCHELRIIDAIKKYHHQRVSLMNLGRVREDILDIVRDARDNHVDISELFPIKIDAGLGTRIRIFQSGDVYIHSQCHIRHIFDSDQKFSE